MRFPSFAAVLLWAAINLILYVSMIAAVIKLPVDNLLIFGDVHYWFAVYVAALNVFVFAAWYYHGGPGYREPQVFQETLEVNPLDDTIIRDRHKSKSPPRTKAQRTPRALRSKPLTAENAGLL